MNGFEAYKMYLALKMHFKNDKYDFVKYNGSVKASIDSFEKRNDKYFFHKLASKFDTNELLFHLAANFLENPDIWIRDLLSESAYDRARELKKQHGNITYRFKEETETLKELLDTKGLALKDIMEPTSGTHPIFLQMYLCHELSIDTFLIFNEVFDLFNVWEKKIVNDTVIWPETRKKCLKYRSLFGNIFKNRKRFINILRENFL